MLHGKVDMNHPERSTAETPGVIRQVMVGSCAIACGSVARGMSV